MGDNLMVLGIDASNDFGLLVSGGEQISLYPRGAAEPVAIQNAVRGPVEASESEPSGGAALQADAEWRFQLPGGAAPPEVGDSLVDASGTAWVALSTNHSQPLNRWSLATRVLKIEGGCPDRVDIQRPIWEEDEIVGWRHLVTALPVKIQLDQIIQREVGDTLTSQKEYRIIMVQQIEMQEDDRIVRDDGTVYRLLALEQPDRIDVPLVARVVPE